MTRHPGFVVESDANGMTGATCQTCQTWRLICVRCQDPTKPAMYRLDPPYGSQDSRDDMRVCVDCYWAIVDVVRRTAGLPPVVRP